MIWKLERKEPCPWCGIDIDLESKKFPMDKKKIIDCPWCGRKVRVKKIRRQVPKEDRGIKFILTRCKKEGCGRR